MIVFWRPNDHILPTCRNSMIAAEGTSSSGNCGPAGSCRAGRGSSRMPTFPTWGRESANRTKVLVSNVLSAQKQRLTCSGSAGLSGTFGAFEGSSSPPPSNSRSESLRVSRRMLGGEKITPESDIRDLLCGI